MVIDDLLRYAVEQNASDLHLSVGSPPILRVKGELVPVPEEPVLLPQDVEGLFRSITGELQQQAFLREKELDFSYNLPGLARFRINVCYERGNLSLSFRLLPYTIPGMEELGLPPVARELIVKPRGLLLVTGPTGAGKSTTLASLIDYLNDTESRRIVTVEDPIEFVHRNKKCIIIQRELGSDTLSFASALKHVLRQDPNVILIGELRDLETIAVAVTAAETGHLILSTLHTMNAAQTVDRIIDVFPPHQQPQIRVQLSQVLLGVFSQLLLPRANGQGRVAAFEVLVTTPAIANLIREGKTFQMPTFMQMSRQMGMQTMDQSLINLVQAGKVTLEEAMAKATNPQELSKLSKTGKSEQVGQTKA